MSGCHECGAKSTGKYAGPCSKCGVPLCPRHALFHFDDTNRAITANARPECPICFGVRNRSGVLDYRNLLLSGDYQHRDVARARFVIVDGLVRAGGTQ